MTTATTFPASRQGLRAGDTARNVGGRTAAFREPGQNPPDRETLAAVAADIRHYDALVRTAESALDVGEGPTYATPEGIIDLHNRVRIAANRAARAINDMAQDFDVPQEVSRALTLYRRLTAPKYLYSQSRSVTSRIEVAFVKVIDAARSLYRRGE